MEGESSAAEEPWPEQRGHSNMTVTLHIGSVTSAGSLHEEILCFIGKESFFQCTPGWPSDPPALASQVLADHSQISYFLNIIPGVLGVCGLC